MNIEYFLNRVMPGWWVVVLFTAMFTIVMWILPLLVGTKITRQFIRDHIRYYTLIPILPFLGSLLFAYSVQVPIQKLDLKMCSGLPLKGTASYQPGAGIHPIYLADASTGSFFSAPYIFSDLPEGTEAQYLADLQIVACFSTINETKLNCGGYTPGGNSIASGNAYSIISHDYQIQFIAAKTGQLMKTTVVQAIKPEKCPDAIPASMANNTDYEVPGSDRVQAALRSFVDEISLAK